MVLTPSYKSWCIAQQFISWVGSSHSYVSYFCTFGQHLEQWTTWTWVVHVQVLHYWDRESEGVLVSHIWILPWVAAQERMVSSIAQGITATPNSRNMMGVNFLAFLLSSTNLLVCWPSSQRGFLGLSTFYHLASPPKLTAPASLKYALLSPPPILK